MDRIFLIGPPGAGKTACGIALAEKLSCPFYDTDHLIQAQQKRTIAEIFASEGEPYFRQLESTLLENLQASDTSETAVFATGGGLPIYNDNLARLLQLGKVIALSADLDVLVDRVKTNTNRPLLQSGDTREADKHLRLRLTDLLDQRSAFYALAGYKIDTTRLKPDQVADEIVKILNPV